MTSEKITISSYVERAMIFGMFCIVMIAVLYGIDSCTQTEKECLLACDGVVKSWEPTRKCECWAGEKEEDEEECDGECSCVPAEWDAFE